MQDLIENLRDISNRVLEAKKINDYDEIIHLDNHRKLILDEIFSRGLKKLSEENIATIKSIAEANEKMISEISIAGTKKAENAHKKMTALKGYNK